MLQNNIQLKLPLVLNLRRFNDSFFLTFQHLRKNRNVRKKSNAADFFSIFYKTVHQILVHGKTTAFSFRLINRTHMPKLKNELNHDNNLTLKIKNNQLIPLNIIAMFVFIDNKRFSFFPFVILRQTNI